jgi:hypothetical protein
MIMKLKIVLAAFVLATSMSTPASAQDEAKIYSIQYNKTETASFDRRYNKCIAEPNCPMQLRLQLMDELYNKLGQTMGSIKHTCERANYHHCVGDKQADVREWHRVNDRMTELMKYIEGRVIHTAQENNSKPLRTSQDH